MNEYYIENYDLFKDVLLSLKITNLHHNGGKLVIPEYLPSIEDFTLKSSEINLLYPAVQILKDKYLEKFIFFIIENFEDNYFSFVFNNNEIEQFFS